MRISIGSVLLTVLVVPQALAADLAGCAQIESAVERLDCYDRLAGRKAGGPAPGAGRQTPGDLRQNDDPQAAVPRMEAPPAATAPPPPPQPDRPPAAATERADAVPARGVEAFGKTPERARDEDIDFIEARIDEITRAPKGQHVMTLSNGQVWMENEPSRRRIKPGQDIVIRRRRWHYEMELPSRPNVPVHRLE